MGVAIGVPAATALPASGLSLQDGIKVCTWTFSTSYTTGGEALSVPGITTIDGVFIVPTAIPAAAAGVFAWNAATGKIQAFVATTGVEVANAVNLSTYTLTLLVFGR